MTTHGYSADFTPLQHTLRLPGSKSQTARELVLSALADSESVLVDPLQADDTERMRHAIQLLGATVREERVERVERVADGHDSGGHDTGGHDSGRVHWRITPAHSGATSEDRIVSTEPIGIDCGQAGTVLRFVPAAAAALGVAAEFTVDPTAAHRPVEALVDALRQLGVNAESSDQAAGTAVSVSGTVAGHEVDFDASASSQFISALLLSGARFPNGVTLRHRGNAMPSLPHIDMTIDALAARGVKVEYEALESEARWRVSPGSIAGRTVHIEPDLSNAAPFLAGMLVRPGELRIQDWPARTTQVGDSLRELLAQFCDPRDLEFTLTDQYLQVRTTAGSDGRVRLRGVDLDLRDAGELAAVLAVLAAIASTQGHESRLSGLAHIRGHESDRLQVLAENLNRLGARVTETPDGLQFHPVSTPLHAGDWPSHHDHRIATAGALLGLAVPGVNVLDIQVTAKTMPTFATLWQQTFGTVGA